jgi:hypothetical protein
MAATHRRKSEPFLLASTLALAALVPLGAHSYLARRVDGDLAPALTALTRETVRIGGVDADLTGAVRLQGVTVGKIMAADAIEAAVLPSPEALARGDLRIREIRVERPRLHVRMDRRGRTDVESLLARMRAHLDERRASRASASAGASPETTMPRIAVTSGALAVALGECGRAEMRGIEIVPRRGGVRAIVANTDLALDCSDWRVQGSLGRAAADIALPGLALERLLAVGGQIDLAVDQPGRAGTRPITLVDLRLAHGVDHGLAAPPADPSSTAGQTAQAGKAPGLALQGRVSHTGGKATFAIAAHRDAAGLHAVFRGNDMPLVPFSPLVPRSVDLSQGHGSGRLTVHLDDDIHVDVDAALSRVLVDDRRVSHVPVELSGRIEAVLATTTAEDGAMRVDLERARFRTGALTVEGRGNVHYDQRAYWLPDRGDIELAVPSLPCADALASLPAGLRDQLAGMQLDGDFQAAARLHFDRANLDATKLDLDVDVAGCRVDREATDADPRRLLTPFEQYFASGTRRRIGAGLPGYAPLGRLPRHVPLAFVAGEDARFYEHRGFDPYQIERSLAVDLRDGAFVRGGSTISQQRGVGYRLVVEGADR